MNQFPSASFGPLIQANGDFALSLYKNLGKKNDNVFFSPLSIFSALAMLHAGARGQTAKQLAAALQITADSSETEIFYKNLLHYSERLGGMPDLELSVANALWGQSGYAFRKEYLKTLESSYRSNLFPVDFKDNLDTARQRINHWIEEKTQGKIRELIQEGTIEPITRMILTNAVYFKSTWMEPFQDNMTRPAPFKNIGLDPRLTLEMPMMYQESQFPYIEEENFQGIELPYSNNTCSLFIFLPKDVDGLVPLEKKLNSNFLQHWTERMTAQTVQVYLPKFKLNPELTLAETLQTLGIKLPFSPEADFSRITEQEPVWVSEVIHQAFVEVNEIGTEAAAATAMLTLGEIAPDIEAPPVYVFNADHPFLFFIRENLSEIILFFGRLTDPR